MLSAFPTAARNFLPLIPGGPFGGSKCAAAADGKNVRLRQSKTGTRVVIPEAKGWKIVTVLPNAGGAVPLQEWSLVAIQCTSITPKGSQRLPNAAIRVDSEANAELLAKYDVRLARSARDLLNTVSSMRRPTLRNSDHARPTRPDPSHLR